MLTLPDFAVESYHGAKSVSMEYELKMNGRAVLASDLPPLSPTSSSCEVGQPYRTVMKKSLFTTEQFIGFIKQPDAGVSSPYPRTLEK